MLAAEPLVGKAVLSAHLYLPKLRRQLVNEDNPSLLNIGYFLTLAALSFSMKFQPPRPPWESWLGFGCGLLLSACGGSSDAGFSEGHQGGASSLGSAGNPSHGGSSAGGVATGGAAVGGAAAGGAPAVGGSAMMESAGAAQGGSAALAGSAGACSSSEPCVACLCSHCGPEVSACEATPGCPAIAECVSNSKCQGTDCYCGTVDLLSCAAGTANGPCLDVILSAPGARKPTLADQSAGPASDAAVAVGNCGASESSGCSSACQ